MSIYDRANDRRLPPVLKQSELTDKTFLIAGLERSDGEHLPRCPKDCDRDHAFYIGDILVDGTETRAYLTGTAVMPILDLLAADAEGLPSVWKQEKRATRGGGNMYDLVEPDAADIKRLLAAYRKLAVVEAAS